MANPDKKAEEWKKAKKLCRLNEETVRMAKEMGLNPRSLIKNIPAPNQQWKAPVHVWIHELYEERQEKAAKKAAAKVRQADPGKRAVTGGSEQGALEHD
ncbi:hypothetical protein M6D81_10285 [Paenibacillus sp. J5C_2022]|uniref:hypothetical protein n=1 Tax=Paenibacillus sp. J5C2022 TaxID=2977129 RepID=UPI0021D03B4E|nr:hypothetical protein [Paenibacillus sp. J5C2022]MCU6709100.1 hypothetical protein [Paenibacillus sp. J5C2022]